MPDDIIEIVIDFIADIIEAIFSKRRKNKKRGGQND